MELRDDLPLLVVAAVPRPLIDSHAVSGAVADNIQRLATVLGFELIITTNGNRLPGLVIFRYLLHIAYWRDHWKLLPVPQVRCSNSALSVVPLPTTLIHLPLLRDLRLK